MVGASGEVRVFHQEVKYPVPLLANIYSPAEPQGVLLDLELKLLDLMKYLNIIKTVKIILTKRNKN